MEITKELVAAEYSKIKDQCSAWIPLDRWSIQPTDLSYTSHKTKYGMATPNGEVLISTLFLGTTAIEKLRNTLRHEFAHLAAGLENNHNRRFRDVLDRFDGTFEVSESDQRQIEGNIVFKYILFAHMVSGERVELGGAHRKSSKYTTYVHGQNRLIRFQGKPVERFEYRLC